MDAHDARDETASRTEIAAQNLSEADAALAAWGRVSKAHLRRFETTRSSLESKVDRAALDRTPTRAPVVPIWLQDQETRPPPPPQHERNMLWPRAFLLLIPFGIAASLFYYFSVSTVGEHQTDIAAGAPPSASHQGALSSEGVKLLQQVMGRSARLDAHETEPAIVQLAPPGSPAPGDSAVSMATTNWRDVKLLMGQGNQFFEAGDLIAARVLLLRAVIAGDAEAAVALGATYDPIHLADHDDRGTAADLDKARSWYERATEMGSPEGPRRLEMLANR
jgi:hypothetical protein